MPTRRSEDDLAGSRRLKNDSGQQMVYRYRAANELTLLQLPSGQPTTATWGGDDPLAQVDLSGNLVAYWSWAPELPEGRWSRLVKERFPGTNAHPDQYVHSDWLGTVIALSLPDGTALVQYKSTPRPWGEQENSAAVPLSWVGNQGYWAERQLARPMHYVRARWYMDADAQGWLSPDPLGFRGGDWNLYRYVRNRPTVLADPTGLRVRFCYRPVQKAEIEITPPRRSTGRGAPLYPPPKVRIPIVIPSDPLLLPIISYARIFSHWFLWTDACGCVGWGPQGVIPTCLGNLGEYSSNDVTCIPETYTPLQERCICKLAAALAAGGMACGRTWTGPQFNVITNKCQNFVNCLLVTCVGPSAAVHPQFGIGTP